MMKRLLTLGCLMLAACMSLPTPVARRDAADALAARHGWQRVVLPAGAFELVAYVPDAPRTEEGLTVYIEGDGFAWLSPSQPSIDPTPIDPVGLKLALADPAGNAAYLARPCQYVDAAASGCSQEYWTQARFAPEVIAAEDRALDLLKSRFRASRLTLVGYSGGGTVAALLAARRSDVARLVTVAGNLDPAAWARHHHVLPLTGSLNPADAVDALRGIPQWHFVGGRDAVIPPELAESFASRFPEGRRPAVRIEPEFDHACCWVESWPRLMQEIR